MTHARVAASLFERVLNGLNDGDLAYQLQVSVAFRRLIEDREITLRGQAAAITISQFPPPPRSEPKHGIL